MKETKLSNRILFLLTLFITAVVVTPVCAVNPPLQTVDKAYENSRQDAMGICPPFYLLDQEGRVINPVKGINVDVPYSPEKTCGRCHDYKKITQGYHFQQGKGEKIKKDYAETYPWCTSPGQYGGRW